MASEESQILNIDGSVHGDLNVAGRDVNITYIYQESALRTSHKVFISSTLQAMPQHLKAVRDACMRMGKLPVSLDNKLGEVDGIIEQTTALVDDSALFIGVFASKYGDILEGHDISLIEMEYKLAGERGIPRLLFFMGDDHPVADSDVEKGLGASRLAVFKQRIINEEPVKYFNSPEELRRLTIQSLMPYRVTDADHLHSPFASDIPLPPEPYIAHPYTLLQTGQLIGRQEQLDKLSHWSTQPDAPIFNFIVAIGGMGKSALSWKWFNDVAPHVMKPLAGRMWWSFYETDASFDNFVARALSYVSQQSREAVTMLSLADREQELLSYLDREPYLLVFDGLERIMVAYTRMDAARLSDDDLDERTANYVSNMPGFNATKHHLRKTADPRVGMFLRKMTQIRRSKILVSTRLYPAELQTVTGDPLPGSNALFLHGMEDEDALVLWHSLGVGGERKTLTDLFHSFDNYPLLIRALAGEVANYRRAPGDFDQWQAAHPGFDPYTLPVMQVKSHVLEHALQGLTADAHNVLNVVAAFRMPASYDTLVALLVGDNLTFSSETQLDKVLTECEDRGLLGWDKRANRYDLHPIVRGVVWDKLSGTEQKTIYQAFHRHFETQVAQDESKVTGIDDLAAAIELYNALVGLGRYDDAAHLYLNRLNMPFFYGIGSTQQRIELLELLFSEGTVELPQVKNPSYQSHIINLLVLAYIENGRPGQAVPVIQRHLEREVQTSELKARDAGYVNLSWASRLTGQFYKAEWSSRIVLNIARERKDRILEAQALQELGAVLGLIGRVDDSVLALERARRIFENRGAAQAWALVSVSLGRVYLSQGDDENTLALAQELADKGAELAGMIGIERDIIRSARLQGAIALRQGALEYAEAKLYEALNRSRTANIMQNELPLLALIAELHTARGQYEQARNILADIWDIAEDGPYPIAHANALLVLADIEHEEGSMQKAVEAARHAYKVAWCDGPMYNYAWGIQKASQLLTSWGYEKPSHPSISKAEQIPIPMVAIDLDDRFSPRSDSLSNS